MKKNLVLLAILLLFTRTITAPIRAEPIQATQETAIEAHDLIHHAAHSMDKAWDAFHKGALGGTLASPEIQTSVEADLMEGRALLRKARKAQHEGKIEKVRSLTEQIQQLSKQIVIKSQMEKE
ncbi:MAG: hypothetical protein ACQ9IQ_00620 [Nitrospirales bacterium]|jgi:hypothetical protein